ncbi:MAG: PLP-dependent aminotransferase family protein [Comamonadaceae bacterium]|nr:PLP-dependent aminotransferase family protein [Comamonadaceae bacterium]
MFALQPHSNVPLVQQIVAHFTGLIEEGKLRLGAKLPSIRQFAKTHSVSVFTVADAYDRLVAQGYLVSRANSGFFVKRMADVDASAAGTGVRRWAPFDAMWCLREVFENRDLALKPGCGWIPDGWLFNEGLQRGLRALAADGGDFGGYGDPQGYRPLRQSIRDVMLEQDITVSLAQILLTQGSSQALDLVARSLIKPGDAVLVDDPGYANLLHSLRFLGARLLGVPRSPDGYDLGALESLIKEHRPKVFLTQPRLHSPTGSVASLAQMHRVLNLIERHDMLLVENDIYADLDPLVRQSFASLDQLDRVIHIRSFSKALSPNLRVGYLLASADLVEDFAQMKMMSGLTSSEISERITHHVLMDGRWRKHLKALSGRLADAHGRTAERLLQLGFKLFAQPRAGLFLWAHHPELPDSDVLSAEAAENGIMMGPGHLYSTSLEATNWMRFNPAYCDDERIFDFLKTALAQRGAKPSIQAA